MLILFLFDKWNRFYRPMLLKTVLVFKMHINDVITLKLCKAIELIKCNVCVKYEFSTKWVTPGNKENRFMTSSFKGPLKPDSKNTYQLIISTVFYLLIWNFQDWLDIIWSPSRESLKLVRSAERILLTKNCKKLFWSVKYTKKT